jgi:hypothetical protein
MQKFDHNIGFREKRKNFFAENWQKSQNCDNNIDPRSLCSKSNDTNYYDGVILTTDVGSFGYLANANICLRRR